MTTPSVLFVDHAGVMGGAQHSLLDIAEAHRDRGAIALMEDGPYASALESRGVRVIRLGGGTELGRVKKSSRVPGIMPVLALLRLARELARIAEPFDVLYANTPKSFLVAALAGRMSRRPVIWHLRDILGEGHFSGTNVRAVVTASNWGAASIIANSHATADAFVRAGGRRELVTVVHNGIDAAPYDALPSNTRDTVRAELGIASDAFVVGSFSRLHPWKGQTVLLDAIARMPNAHALIVGGALFSGEAPYEAELRARAALPPLVGRVHMLGARNDVPRLLAACDVVAHASVLAEPFGRVLVEAMLAGRPVVATRAGGVPEVVTDGETGLLVPPGDADALCVALENLRQDGALSARLTRQGANHARRVFSREAMLAGVSAVLTDVGGGGRPATRSGGNGARIAIVHDYLNQAGGAERVVGVLHRMFPDAPIYATLYDPRAVGPEFADADVRVSWMQRLPGWRRHFRAYLALYPFAVRSFDLRGFDVVITSSSAWAKGVRVPSGTFHLCYCHTPMRWAWSFDGYVARSSLGSVARFAARLAVAPLRRWDIATSLSVDQFVANSTEVARRIRTNYGRRSEIVFPPVDSERFRHDQERGDFFLVVSRLNAYKRIDLAVRACTELSLPLVVVGDGPERSALMRLAGPTVRFMGRLPDDEVTTLFERCRAFVLPGEEDFGITPLEANAAGAPVIAFARGGALDTVRDGETGVLFPEENAESLGQAMLRVNARLWDVARLRAHAQSFSQAVFVERFRTALAATLGDARRGRAGVNDAA